MGVAGILTQPTPLGLCGSVPISRARAGQQDCAAEEER